MAEKKESYVKTALSIIIALVILIVIAGGIFCVATQQSPASAVAAFSSNDEKIVGKWQSREKPGLSALVFKDDGTYISYLSTVEFNGNYTIEGNKIHLENPTTNKEIVYKFSVSDTELVLQVVEEDGEESQTKEETRYDKVDELNQKSISDLIGEIAGEVSEESTEDE